MKIFVSDGLKVVVPQSQRVRIDVLGYRRYEAMAKHVKPF